MLPLSIFRERQFAATSAVTFIVYAALTGATFLFPLVLQVVSGYSPLASGLALLPLTVIMLALSARSGQLASLPSVVVFGLGLAITVAPLTATAMSSAPAQHAGIAAGFRTAVLISGGLCAAVTTTSPRRAPGQPGRPCPRNACIAGSRRHH
jgi:hypothetical protein